MAAYSSSDGGGAAGSSSSVWPLSSDSICFIDSPSSPSFSLFLSALDRASIVAMDAEWKPNLSSQRKSTLSSCSRVSIMQIALRIRSDLMPDSAAINPSSTSSNYEAVKSTLPNSVNLDLPLPSSEHSDEEPSESMESDGKHSHALCKDQGFLEHSVFTDQIGHLSMTSAEDGASKSRINSADIKLPLQPSAEEDGASKSILNSADIELPYLPSTCSENKDSKTIPAYIVQNDKKYNVLRKGQLFMERSFNRLKDKEEMIFLLDMMSLPASSFWESMKRMLVSPTVLKLGFKFKQDLLNLAKSFPGPDAHSCFDKVDPYVDIGKLYREIHGWNDLPMESLSLATICEKVVGYNLCKDLQCSNWEQRPLTVEQQVYAAADAHCLLVAYDILESDASESYDASCYHTTSRSKDGIAELLLVEGVNFPSSDARGSVLHAHRGIASVMVRSAISEGMLWMSGFSITNASATHLRMATKFGERLLVDTARSSKLVQRKPKIHRGKKVEQMDACYWFELPPWDPSLGGDGFPKFLCDNMVEGLAKQLRNVGIDTVSLRQKSDPRKLVELAEKEGRVLLTQDVKLLRRRLIPRNLAYRVRSLSKQEQLAEVVKTFNLIILEDNLLSRCTKCNGNFIPEPLTPEEAVASVADGQSIPEYAIAERLLFWQCSVCMHMYWQGNQFHRALETFQAFARKVQMSQQVTEKIDLHQL